MFEQASPITQRLYSDKQDPVQVCEAMRLNWEQFKSDWYGLRFYWRIART